jgi:glycosyltransferase involved in cell wall biosynthesis
MKTILVMPQFNEARSIISVLEAAYNHVNHTVVVDDGSTDHSGQLIRDWMDSRPGVTLISLGKNRGMSGALLVGFCYVNRLLREGLAAPGDVVVNMDADGQHRAEEIAAGSELLTRGGYDVVLGRRDLSGYPRFKQFGNTFLSWWASALTGVRYHDVECGFRFMRADLVPRFLRFFTGRKYGCAQEIGVITALLGARIDNDFATVINYYRPGAKLTDGFVNMAMGGLAALRVRLRMANDLDRLEKRVLAGACIANGPEGESFWVAGAGS